MAKRLYIFALSILNAATLFIFLSNLSALRSFPKALPINFVVSLNLKTLSVEMVGAKIIDHKPFHFELWKRQSNLVLV